MTIRTKNFKKTAAVTLRDDHVLGNLAALYDRYHQARDATTRALPDWEELRERGRAVKAHTLENLDYYLELLEKNVTAAGGRIFFARDHETASRYIVDLARSKGVKLVIKGKSMVAEELELNDRLSEADIEPVETDLGEYILQLAGDIPFHILAPAIHKSQEDISELFQEKLSTPKHARAGDLTREARAQLRQKFIAADMSVTGANFMVAETGTVVLLTNEGNGRMCTSMPKVHVAVAGMEKVIPSIDDLGIMLRLLARGATGQPISTYLTTINGPRRSEEEDGPEEFHLVIVDSGRSRLLADPSLREVLYCLRCSACLNACPVYRKVGGHAYGWVYSGPIGAIVSPMLTGLSDGKDLPYASSLCGACREACPVKINIPRMLLYLRKELAEGGSYPRERNAPVMERIAMKGWRFTVANTLTLGLANWAGRLLQRPLARRGWLGWLPPPLSAWTRHRRFPAIAARPFRDRWKRLSRE